MPPTRRLPIHAALLALLLLLAACGGRSAESPAPAGNAVKIQVADAGFYRVTRAELAAAGLDVPLAGDALAVSRAGVPVPFLVADDSLIFYGTPSTSRFDAYAHYVVRAGADGVAMAASVAAATAGDVAATVGVATVPQTTRVAPNRFYEPRALDDDHPDVWFGFDLNSIAREKTVTVDIDLPLAPVGAATLALQLWGATFDDNHDPDHDFDVIVNDQPVGQVAWDGAVHHSAAITLPAGLLRAGTNQIILDNSAQGAVLIDRIKVDWLELRYQVAPQAVDDRLVITGVDGVVRAGGFSAPPALFDISDPAAPRRVDGAVTSADGVTVPARSEQTLALVGPNGYRQAASVVPLLASTLADPTNAADLLIVTTRALAPALTDLVTAREADGLRVVVALTDEIYDTFGGGDESAESIHAFLRHAHADWTAPAPRYLLLVGDATTDTLGYLTDRDGKPVPPPANSVPSPLIAVNYSGETVSDARLADMDNDGVPELAVGRWPVSQPAEVRRLVARTLAYERGSAADGALFTIDGAAAGAGINYEFTSFIDNALAASAFPVEQTAILNAPEPGAVAGGWNAGAWLVGYVGHGSLDTWGQSQFFSAEQVADLRAGATPPIVLQFTCLTGQFAHPEVESLSETLLKDDDGPVLIVAATSLTLSGYQAPFAVALLTALQQPEHVRAGDAFLAAKQALDVQGNRFLREVSDTFGLIGDPSARLVRPPAVTAAGVP